MPDVEDEIAGEARLLSGTDALVEVLLRQKAADRKRGLSTAGFVSGYRGSPLGGFDQALWSRRAALETSDIRFEPGLNEDLAATAVWGTQQVGLFPGATVGGVFGMWYGKGPGVDRSLDALKHGNAAGSARQGGVLLVEGDDHGCVSSTLPHQSGPVFASALIPTLNPSSVEEIIDYGAVGFALSRYSGCWVGLTGATQVVETSALVRASIQAIVLPEPTDAFGDLWLRLVDTPLGQEARLHGPKMAAVGAFARAAGLDRMALSSPAPRLVIVTTGKAYADVREALRLIDLPEAELARMGLAVFKVGLTWPLEVEGITAAVSGVEEALVIEEKRGFVEDQLVRILYNAPADRRPRVVGKTDEIGRTLLPSEGEISAVQVARIIADRLARIAGRPVPLIGRLLTEPDIASQEISPKRTPFFCAGCPHSTSTNVPEGSRAMGGIGCHGMATWMPDRNTQLLTHMGAEGVTWIGQSPYTTETHVFQNMGDGTYNHSGLLAIRAAVAARVNITYKVLYNDAVAMTGGQPHEGALTVDAIVAQLLAEGVGTVVVVAEQLTDALRGRLPKSVAYRPRDELDAVQKTLRETPGVTAIVYDQTCAAELRRRRKRGEAPIRTTHLVINPEVCEGCGDCGVQSNCIAIQPLETSLGRKRRIDPDSCNQDYSCLKGFCPSFVTVETNGSHERPRAKLAPEGLPEPEIKRPEAPWSVLVAGIGGTGVVTVGAILGAAARNDGLTSLTLAMTGLSQKNGAVQSQVRIGPADAVHSGRIPPGGADLVLACDLAAAAAADALSLLHAGSVVVGNRDFTPTSAFVRNGAIDLGFEAARRTIASAAGIVDLVEAEALAVRRVGAAQAANVVLLGYAWQTGRIPLSLSAMRRAIEAGPGKAANLQAFQWGRAVALEGDMPMRTPVVENLNGLVDRLAAELKVYHDAAYASRFTTVIARVRLAETGVGGNDTLARVAARGLFKLMAYKDEYEVARLHLSSTFAADLRERFGSNARLSYNLAPTWLGRNKHRFGAWVILVFRALAAARGLRGTMLDPFGASEERRAERGLVSEYEALLDRLIAGLTAANHGLAVEAAEAVQDIKGYGHVKAASLPLVRARTATLMEAFEGERIVPSAA
ncbi:indolepyruvate ferredoxin oxidoreductase family protein [soil metagenome]